jgi:hypothetical protein
VELGIGEAEDDGEYGPGDVAEEKWEEGWYFPVLALPDNYVQITADLVAL